MRRRTFLALASGVAGVTAVTGATAVGEAAAGTGTTACPGSTTAGSTIRAARTPAGRFRPSDPAGNSRPSPPGNESTGGNDAGNESTGGNETGGSSPTDDENTAGSATRTVEMTDSLSFAPKSITVAPGTTVVWKNVGTVGHTVTAYEDAIPDESAYFASGGYDSESAARDGYGPDGPGVIPGGGTYGHTFETTGTYEYFCVPHVSTMKGTVEVREGGGSAASDPQEMGVPFRAHYVGLATLAGIVLSLSYAFYLLKYGVSAHTSSAGRS